MLFEIITSYDDMLETRANDGCTNGNCGCNIICNSNKNCIGGLVICPMSDDGDSN